MSEENQPVQIKRRGRPPRKVVDINGGEQEPQDLVNGGEFVDPQLPRSIKTDLLIEGENKEFIELSEAVAQMSDSNCKVRLYRLGQLGAQPYLAEMPVSAFSLEYVKNEFGGGDYIVQFITSDGKFFKRLPFKIDASFKSRQQREDDARRLAAVATGVPVQQQNDNTAVIIQLMQTQNQESKQMFQLMLNMQLEGQKSLMLMMGKMFERGPGVIAPGNYGGQATIIEALTPLLLSKVGADIPRTGGLLDDVDKLLKLKLLFAGDRDKDDEDEDMMSKVIKLLGPAAAGLLTKAVAPQALPAAQVQTVQPAQVTAQPLAGAPQPPPIPAGVIEQLRMALPLLLNAANKQSAPESYYEFVSDNLNDDLYDQLAAILEKDDWIEVLFGNPPEILGNAQVKEWFEKLRGLFLDEAGSGGDSPQQ